MEVIDNLNRRHGDDRKITRDFDDNPIGQAFLQSIPPEWEPRDAVQKVLEAIKLPSRC